MLKHDFYADPTIFDQWQNDAGNWFCLRFEKLCPYAWVIGFSVLGLLFLVLAAGVWVSSLQYQASASLATDMNRLLAECVTLVMALIATQILFKQALAAWPEHVEKPGALRKVLGYIGLHEQARQTPIITEPPQKNRLAATQAERQAVQDFFTGVRTAGVNVSIAKALFAAGIRSSHQLCLARDEHLHAIHGVGPATVRKLRAHFDKS